MEGHGETGMDKVQWRSLLWPGTMERQGGKSQDSEKERMSDDLVP